METLLVKRNRARTIACAAAAVLVCLALAGCGRPAATSSPTVPQASASPAGTVGGENAPGSTPTTLLGAPTADPVASELDQINQLINDIDNSVQSSDSSQQGGE